MKIEPMYPTVRLRRMRRTGNMRRLVQETQLSPLDFVYPIFTVHGQGLKQEVSSLPGVYRYSLDLLPEVLERVADLGIPSVILFGLPEVKDEIATEGYDPQGIIQQAVAVAKRHAPDLVTIADLCLGEFT